VGQPVKYLLPESDIPTHWVNLLPDLPGTPLPPLHPGTKEPLGPEDLAPIFPMGLIAQEVSAEPDIAAARRGFLDGGNHPDDIDGLIRMFRLF
jgi:tryptophan synthase beta chain